MSTDQQKDDYAVSLYLDLLKKTLTNTIYHHRAGRGERSFVREGVHRSLYSGDRDLDASPGAARQPSILHR